MRFEKTIPCGERETSKKRKMTALRCQSSVKEPTIWVGKNGVTKELLSQVSRQLEVREMVKVKAQKTSLEDSDVSKIADQIAGATGSEIIDVRGRTFTVYKQRKKGQRQTRA
jgi:RNA-binding protein